MSAPFRHRIRECDLRHVFIDAGTLERKDIAPDARDGMERFAA